MLQNDQEIPVCRIKSLLGVHALSSREYKNSKSLFHCWVSSSSYQLQTVYPIHIFVQIKRIPPQLIGNLMQLVSLGICIVRGSFARIKWRVCSGRENPVQPRLLILVSRSCKCRAGELFRVQAVGRFLWRVSTYWK